MLTEDPPHDLGLALVDRDLATQRATVLIRLGHRVKAVRHLAGGESGERPTFETSQRLVAQVVEVQVGYQALDGERKLRVLRARIDAVGDADGIDTSAKH